MTDPKQLEAWQVTEPWHDIWFAIEDLKTRSPNRRGPFIITDEDLDEIIDRLDTSTHL